MPHKNVDLHGNAPEKSATAILLIDVINDLEFPEGAQLLTHALPMAARIAELRERAREVGIPIIHVNDNFGRWQSNFHNQVEHCLHDGVRGQALVELLRPDEERDYFVLKPKHSGFFSTVLDVLLRYLRVERLILCGVAGNICVLFTAQDAYVRDYELFVPRDCVASNTTRENDDALGIMERILGANVSQAAELDLRAMQRRRDPAHEPRAMPGKTV
ncbi:MAG: isochorismatase family cysteine hydrolase [Pirellulales bacterium]